MRLIRWDHRAAIVGTTPKSALPIRDYPDHYMIDATTPDAAIQHRAECVSRLLSATGSLYPPHLDGPMEGCSYDFRGWYSDGEREWPFFVHDSCRHKSIDVLVSALHGTDMEGLLEALRAEIREQSQTAYMAHGSEADVDWYHSWPTATQMTCLERDERDLRDGLKEARP
jgi:hypothetical protein